jgi:HD-like signal output (HDOD) protein
MNCRCIGSPDPIDYFIPSIHYRRTGKRSQQKRFDDPCEIPARLSINGKEEPGNRCIPGFILTKQAWISRVGYEREGTMNRILIDRERLDAIESLPTLPTVATQLLEMLGHSEISLNEISRLMEQDPSITAQVLRVANSAIYGLRRKASTVQQALVVLGVNEAANIILSLSLFKTFTYLREADFDLKEFWLHCGIVGYLSRFLARKFNISMYGEEFTAGLMHDLGKIVFAQYFHEDFLDVIDYLAEHPIPSHEAERTVLGVTHNEIGYWLGLRWGIPVHILEAIRWHHEPDQAVDQRNLVAIVALADIYALRNANLRYDEQFRPDPVTSEAWRMLNVNLDADALQEVEDEVIREIEKAGEFLAMVF